MIHHLKGTKRHKEQVLLSRSPGTPEANPLPSILPKMFSAYTLICLCIILIQITAYSMYCLISASPT